MITVTLVWLAACSASPTSSLIPTSLESAAPALSATHTPPATVTSAPEATSTEINDLVISPAASSYLEAALEIMQEHGINRLNLDWDALRTEAFRQARQAQTEAETYDAIRYVLGEAGGQHSNFLTPDMASQALETTTSDSPAPRGKLLLGKLGYIAMEGFTSPDSEEGAKYATTLQGLIRDLDTQGACGWLVDLRENTGGNMWPMLAGIGPILGEGQAGAFVNPDGDSVDWSYHQGQSLIGNSIQVQVSGPAYQLRSDAPPVAVLTGVNTASSGEAIAVSFIQRPNTRSFGLYTAGFTTGNVPFRLSDGALIILTSAIFADRTGQTYGERINPDEVVDEARNFTMISEEAIPQPAVDWLMSQPACATTP